MKYQLTTSNNYPGIYLWNKLLKKRNRIIFLGGGGYCDRVILPTHTEHFKVKTVENDVKKYLGI